MKWIVSTAAMVLSFIGSPAQAQEFDFEQAAAIEGTFRGIVKHCADPEFAKTFIEGSKAQVQFSLQGDNTVVPVSFVEGLIEQYASRPELKELSDAQCQSFVSRLMQLHESRDMTLRTTKELTQTLKESAEQGTPLVPMTP